MEGPSIVLLKEELKKFIGKRVLKVSGNTKEPKEKLKGLVLKGTRSWGKVIFLEFAAGKGKRAKSFWTRTHFMMFGSYRIDDPKPDRHPRLQLEFSNGIYYIYACSFKFTDESGFKELEPRVDVLGSKWDEDFVLDLVEQKKDVLLCDLFLDQNLFAGSGNIVKNEVLFNMRRHPLTKLSQIRRADWPLLVHAIREYCEDFYRWKKKFELRRHWQVYRKHKCPLCGEKLKREKLGKFERATFYCAFHQKPSKRGTKLVVHDVLPPLTEAKGKEKPLDH